MNMRITVMDDKDTYIFDLENKIRCLNNKVTVLEETLGLMRKQKFGASSEKTPKADTNVDGQMFLFNEAEAEANDKEAEPIVKKVKGYLRENARTKREEIIKDLPIQEMLCDIPVGEQYCSQCGEHLKPIGKNFVREELEYIPAKLQIIRYVQMVYGCPACKNTDHPYIKKALTPSSLMNHSLASPSSVAHVMYEKYVNSVPLYRQEQTWSRLGMALTRATMANWIIRCAQDYFLPIVDYMRKELVKRDVIHCDETTVQVLKEPGKKPQTQSYMWLYRTGNDTLPPIVIYDYRPSRNGDNAVDFLKGFKGYVHCDGYVGYNKLQGIIRCGCWAHLRRKFIEAIPQHKTAAQVLTNAEIGRNYCDKLFAIEKVLSEISAEERFTKRLELEKPILEAFWCWLEKLSVLNNSAMGKAIKYANNQRPYLENYLLDGRCSISNNIAENAIRPFTIGRKNWLFSDTPKGASASAAVYSIIETAKANSLEVYTYLQYLLLYMPDCDWHNHPEDLEDLMPWSQMVKTECGKE